MENSKYKLEFNRFADDPEENSVTHFNGQDLSQPQATVIVTKSIRMVTIGR
ncbi:hypothetical protein [Pollutibacter soli]|uniref:hypothetical protein n=1 Tax=Pollutibacter soli TaxID=3034157 RepID=UPI00301357BD